jgi:hypothetical protein
MLVPTPGSSYAPMPATVAPALRVSHVWLLHRAAVTPPGHYTDATGTYPCPSGHYRPDWLPYGDANTCISCGEGVKSAMTDQITRYDPVSNAPSQMAVTASDNDCCKSLTDGHWLLSCLGAVPVAAL